MTTPKTEDQTSSNGHADAGSDATTARTNAANADQATVDPSAVPGANEAKKALTPEAERALLEAQERRDAEAADAKDKATEIGGRKGPEPTRYGDWEKGGIAWDF